MRGVALKMLFGDRAKYLGLVFGVAFATVLITQQSGVFVGLMVRTSSIINDARDTDIWVMDRSVQYIDTIFPLRDVELSRVRSVDGVEWAVPFYKGQAPVRTPQGQLQNATMLGLDDATLVGLPAKFRIGAATDLLAPDAVAIDIAGHDLLWPGEPLRVGRTLEINDRRAVVAGILDSSMPFVSSPVVYTRYSQALQYTNNGRSRMSFVLAHAVAGRDPAVVADTIQASTGLQALTRADFRWKTIGYYLRNTGIPVNFGTVIAIGILVGIAVVGLTFNMFIADNIRQYAALKAIGLRNGRILRMVLTQAAVVGSIGYGIGTGLAAAFFEFSPRANIQLRGFNLPWQISASVAVAIAVIVVLATLVGLRRVLRVDPAIVFRG